jgi:hypothetical protein
VKSLENLENSPKSLQTLDRRLCVAPMMWPMSNTSTENVATATPTAPDHSLMIGIHRSTAKAIADVIHICAGGAVNGSDDRLEELGSRTLPALVFAIELHLEEANRLQEEEYQ